MSLDCNYSSGSTSGKKNEPKPKLFGPDIFRWGGGLPREGVGAKKFGMPLETREIKLFWQDIPEFCSDIPAAPEKFKKKVCVQFSSPTTADASASSALLKRQCLQ